MPRGQRDTPECLNIDLVLTWLSMTKGITVIVTIRSLIDKNARKKWWVRLKSWFFLIVIKNNEFPTKLAIITTKYRIM